MSWYEPLPTIHVGDFTLPALAQPVDPPRGSSGQARTDCLLHQCGVQWIRLYSRNGADPVQISASATENHADIAPDGRFRMVPLAEPVDVKWTLTNHAGVSAAIIQCFRPDSDVPIFTRRIDNPDADQGEFAWDGSVPADLHFPGDALDEDSYLLRITVIPKPDFTCVAQFARTYFDVRFDHKWKMVSYTPTTTMGRFGLEFDPTARELRVQVRAFFMEVGGAWGQPAATYRPMFVQRCQDGWSDKFRFAHGGAGAWKVRFEVADAGRADAAESDALEDNPQLLTDRFLSERAHLCVSMRPGRGISRLTFRLASKVANLVMYEVGFDTHHPAGPLSQGIVDRQLQIVGAAVQTEIDDADEDRLTFVAATATSGPGFEVGFADGREAVTPLEDALEAIAAKVKELSQGVTMRAFVKGCRKSTEGDGINVRRATAVKAELTLPNTVDADPDLAAPEGKVIVILGYRTAEEKAVYSGQPAPYCAAVHEFGHTLGLPDEYANYADPGPWASTPDNHARTRFLQSHTKDLVDAEALPLWPTPFGNHASLMSTGQTVHERHYVTVLEGFRKLLGGAKAPDANGWTISKAPGPAPQVAPWPDFTRLVEAVCDHGQKLIVEGEDRVAEVERAVLQHAQAAGVRVMYAKLRKRDDLADAGAIAADSELMLTVGVQVGRQILHCATFHKVQLARPIVEVPAFYSKNQSGSEVTVTPRADTDAKRQRVILRSSERFTGHGTFTCASPGVTFSAPASPDTALATAAGLRVTAADLSAGKILYVRGNVHNAAMSLVLTATAGQVSPDTSNVTLKTRQGTPTFEVYPVSVDPAESAEPLGSAERVGVGLYLPVGGDTSPHLENLRARVVVWVPPGYQQKLLFRFRQPRDLTQRVINIYKDGSTKIKGDKKKRGDDTYYEYELDPTGGNTTFRTRGHFANGTVRHMTLWLEGIVATTGAKDVAIEIVPKATPTAPADSSFATVIAIPEVTLKVPTTRPRSARPAIAGNAVPADTQDTTVTALAAQVGGNAAYKSRSFTDNPPVVVVKNAAPDGRPLKIKTRYTPANAAVKWFCVRAADDNADVARNNLNVDTTPLTPSQHTVAQPEATDAHDVPTKAAGSFHLTLKAGSSTLSLANLVVVGATAVAGVEAPAVGNIQAQKDAITQGFSREGAILVRSGQIPFPAASSAAPGVLKNTACTVLAGRVLLIGGGPDGRRGTDRVMVGWIQNKTRGVLEGTYQDGPAAADRTLVGKFVQNQRQGQLIRIDMGGDYHFFGGTVPLEIQNPGDPLLDTGNDPVGGGQTRPGSSHMGALTNQPLGAYRVAVSVDSPGTEFLVRHQRYENALLTRARYEHTFRAFLCAWSDSTGAFAGGNDAKAGELLYAAVGEVTWGFAAAWNVAWPAEVARLTRTQRNAVDGWMARATITADPGADFAVTITSAYQQYPAARCAEGLVEVRPPAPIRTFAWSWPA